MQLFWLQNLKLINSLLTGNLLRFTANIFVKGTNSFATKEAELQCKTITLNSFEYAA